jgi:hypothetical protein
VRKSLLVGELIAISGSVFCFSFPFVWAPRFRAMYQLLRIRPGWEAELALSYWFGILVGLVPVLLIAIGRLAGERRSVRAVLVDYAILIAMVACVCCLVLAYSGEPAIGALKGVG